MVIPIEHRKTVASFSLDSSTQVHGEVPATPASTADCAVTTDATDCHQQRSHISDNDERTPRHWWLIQTYFSNACLKCRGLALATPERINMLIRVLDLRLGEGQRVT